jgi:hypothetical protein
MVQNSGKTLCPGALKPVNLPEPVQVEEDPSGLPLAVSTPRRQAVTAILNRWRIDDEWWRSGAVSRLYYSVLFTSGQQLVIYQDLNSQKWYRQVYW